MSKTKAAFLVLGFQVLLATVGVVFIVLNVFCMYKGLSSLLGGGDPLQSIAWLTGSVALGINTKMSYKGNRHEKTN